MARKLPIDITYPLVFPLKRPYRGDDGKGRESKRRAIKDLDASSGQSGGSGSTDAKTPATGGDEPFTVSIIAFTC